MDALNFTKNANSDSETPESGHDERINHIPPNEDHYALLGLKRQALWDGGRVDYNSPDAYDPNDPACGVEGNHWQSLLSYIFEAFRVLDDKDEMNFDRNEFKKVKARLKSEYKAATFTDVCSVAYEVRQHSIDKLAKDQVKSMVDEKIKDYGLASLTIDNFGETLKRIQAIDPGFYDLLHKKMMEDFEKRIGE